MKYFWLALLVTIAALFGLGMGAINLVFGAEQNPAVYQDAGGNWHINTFPPEEGENPNYLGVWTWAPEDGEDAKGEIFWLGGYADTDDCATNGGDYRDRAEIVAREWIKAARSVMNSEGVVAVSVSICHPEWICLYVEDVDGKYDNYETYNNIFEAHK